MASQFPKTSFLLALWRDLGPGPRSSSVSERPRRSMDCRRKKVSPAHSSSKAWWAERSGASGGQQLSWHLPQTTVGQVPPKKYLVCSFHQFSRGHIFSKPHGNFCASMGHGYVLDASLKRDHLLTSHTFEPVPWLFLVCCSCFRVIFTSFPLNLFVRLLVWKTE